MSVALSTSASDIVHCFDLYGVFKSGHLEAQYANKQTEGIQKHEQEIFGTFSNRRDVRNDPRGRMRRPQEGDRNNSADHFICRLGTVNDDTPQHDWGNRDQERSRL